MPLFKSSIAKIMKKRPGKVNEEKETGIWRSMSWAISGETSIGRIVGWKRNGQVQDKAGKDMVGVGLGWGIKNKSWEFLGWRGLLFVYFKTWE